MTTVTHAAGSAVEPAAPGLTIVWRFPRATGVPLRLDWEEKGEAGAPNELILGRDPGCAVQLDGHDVSRRHAALRRVGPKAGATITDLGSRNGVRVNGRPIATAPLAAQDVVRLGGWIGVVTAAPGEVEEIAPGLWGGAAMRTALAPLSGAAASDLPIILEGETGTGKEVVAGALHRWSGRGGPLVAVNCAALPEALAEGELFGYRRGAFTGADRASPGFFRAAEGGTLLLDEISDLPLALQAKLLRVLEEREVQPLGEARPVPIDVRVVVAGQQSLMDSVRAGRFRADLLARLEGLTVRLPPLRQRREDVLPLFSRLLDGVGRGRVPAVESDFAERLCVHDWPFNVRELVLLVRRILALHSSETTLRAHHLPDRIGQEVTGSPPAVAGPQAPAAAASAEPVQLPALLVALRASGGNVARAAAILGISRQRAYRLMEGQAVDLEGIRAPDKTADEKPR
jgi:transcriptional regulator of acetoin/glycerol metabolism